MSTAVKSNLFLTLNFTCPATPHWHQLGSRVGSEQIKVVQIELHFFQVKAVSLPSIALEKLVFTSTYFRLDI